MSTISANNLFQVYKDQYSTWRDEKDLQAAKRQEYLRRNPDAINDYDLQRTKILLNTVDMMDKHLSQNSNKIGVAFETATSLGLGYAAVGGTALGFLFTKLGFVKKYINDIVKKFPKSKNMISMGITATSGILGILAAYPIYANLSSVQSNIHRKRKFEMMENELKDSKIFAVLDKEQKEIFFNNLDVILKNKPETQQNNFARNELRTIKQVTQEAVNFEKKQSEFEEKYKEDKTFYDKELTDKEIKDAKKDKVLLSVLIKELNTKAQSYNEKMQQITDNLITASFALGSLFTLGYESLAKKMNFKSSSIPAGLGVFLMVASTFLATWAQKRASHIGRYKAKQELLKNPEQLVYISKKKTDAIDDNEVQVEKTKKTNLWEFFKNFFKDNKEYEKWKYSSGISADDISNAMNGIDISPEQHKDAKRMQNNLFKTLYKVDKNTQNFSTDIDILSESVKFPITLILGTFGSVLGMKHLVKLREALTAKEVLKQSSKYVGTIMLFTLPSLFLNSYFAKTQKMGARISDMTTMKELEDYRFFADYSHFKNIEPSP